MALVVYNGQQWDSENLPADVPADDCVPIADWFKANRTGKTTAKQPTPVEADPKPAKRATKRKD